MKKLKTYPSTLMPIWQKDLDFLQDGIKESFAACLASLGLGKDCFVIYGCTIIDNGVNISMLPGWAYWNGEILPVRALNATPHAAGTVKIKLTRIEAYNRDGVKSITAGDNSVTNRDTYREDYLQPSLAGEFDSYDLAISEGF